jgi:hypothetical protein
MSRKELMNELVKIQNRLVLIDKVDIDIITITAFMNDTQLQQHVSNYRKEK